MALRMSAVRNPNSTRTSGAIEVTIAADEAFEKQIASTKELTLAGTALRTAELTDIAISVNANFANQ